MVRPM